MFMSVCGWLLFIGMVSVLFSLIITIILSYFFKNLISVLYYCIQVLAETHHDVSFFFPFKHSLFNFHFC